MLEQFVSNEFDILKKQYNPNAQVKHVEITFDNKKFFEDFKHNVNNDRRGEVAFFVRRKNGKFIVIRSHKYPKGVYRIPTGGIGFNESAIDALKREISEELGILFDINSFLGIVEYKIIYKYESVKFYSYMFEVLETGGVIIEDATQNEITEYEEVDDNILISIGDKMRQIPGRWKDWCMFRSEVIMYFKDLRGE